VAVARSDRPTDLGREDAWARAHVQAALERDCAAGSRAGCNAAFDPVHHRTDGRASDPGIDPKAALYGISTAAAVAASVLAVAGADATATGVGIVPGLGIEFVAGGLEAMSLATGFVATAMDCERGISAECAVGGVGFVAGAGGVGSTAARLLDVGGETVRLAIGIPGDIIGAGMSFVGWLAAAFGG
jgi:hypothetical protein